MKTILSSKTMEILNDIEIKVNARIIKVKGPRGTVTHNFKHLNLDFMLITGDENGERKLKVDAWFGSHKTIAAIRTALSHVSNLIISVGVTHGFRCKMQFVYLHQRQPLQLFSLQL